MRADGKSNVLGVLIDAADYEGAVDPIIIRAAKNRRPIAVSALAVHRLDYRRFGRRTQISPESIRPVVARRPAGTMGTQRPVSRRFERSRLRPEPYAPALRGRSTRETHRFLYGTSQETLTALALSLGRKFPDLVIAGVEPSQFRRLSSDEKAQLAARIRASGAAIVFVGLGCPRQEAFAYEFREALGMPILAVGAAFPFIAGMLPQAPAWMQRVGLEWLYRLACEPKRLWRRYLFLNPAYLVLVSLQLLRLSKFSTNGRSPSTELLYG